MRPQRRLAPGHSGALVAHLCRDPLERLAGRPTAPRRLPFDLQLAVVCAATARAMRSGTQIWWRLMAMTSLTLNKITSQRGSSVGEATKKISD
ncbi:MAG: hypothetical protein EKK31_31105, partial [Hyphomicrobiales bacterium]